MGTTLRQTVRKKGCFIAIATEQDGLFESVSALHTHSTHHCLKVYTAMHAVTCSHCSEACYFRELLLLCISDFWLPELLSIVLFEHHADSLLLQLLWLSAEQCRGLYSSCCLLPMLCVMETTLTLYYSCNNNNPSCFSSYNNPFIPHSLLTGWYGNNPSTNCDKGCVVSMHYPHAAALYFKLL